jgi:hypothetical protein
MARASLLLITLLFGISVGFVPQPVLRPLLSGRPVQTELFLSSRSSTEALKRVGASRPSSSGISVEADETRSVRQSLTASVQGAASSIEQAKADDSAASEEYKKGIAIISFITLLNASLAPVWHTVFAGGAGPPPLFLNAVVSVTALIGLLAFGPFLDGKVETTSALAEKSENAWSAKSFRGGVELGFWKGLGESALGSAGFLVDSSVMNVTCPPVDRLASRPDRHLPSQEPRATFTAWL